MATVEIVIRDRNGKVVYHKENLNAFEEFRFDRIKPEIIDRKTRKILFGFKYEPMSGEEWSEIG